MKCLENIPYETFDDEHTGDGIGLNKDIKEKCFW